MANVQNPLTQSATSNSSPHVGCIIVTHNAGPRVGVCLESLQDAGNVVVVDNGSSDGTAEFIQGNFPNVEVIRSAGNLGYGGAVNLGVQQLDTEYIAILNQDVVGTDQWVERLIGALEQNPDAGMATPRILLADDPGRLNTCGNEVHYTGITPCRGYGQPSTSFNVAEEVSAVSGAAFVVRRSTFDAIGGFDATFFLYLEDTDLSLRAILAGYSCLYVPESVVLHEFTPRFSASKVFFLERNRYLMLVKTYRWRTLFTLGPALLLTELAVWGYTALCGTDALWAKLTADLWIATHWREVWSARQQTQAIRRISDRTLLSHLARDLHLEELGRVGQLAGELTSPLLRTWQCIAGAVISW